MAIIREEPLKDMLHNLVNNRMITRMIQSLLTATPRPKTLVMRTPMHRYNTYLPCVRYFKYFLRFTVLIMYCSISLFFYYIYLLTKRLKLIIIKEDVTIKNNLKLKLRAVKLKFRAVPLLFGFECNLD